MSDLRDKPVHPSFPYTVNDVNKLLVKEPVDFFHSNYGSMTYKQYLVGQLISNPALFPAFNTPEEMFAIIDGIGIIADQIIERYKEDK